VWPVGIYRVFWKVAVGSDVVFGEAAAVVAGSGSGSDLDGSFAKWVCAAMG
jgi:hypothetical protein